MSEIDKEPTWQERQQIAAQKIQDLLGPNTPEAFLEKATNAEDEVNELHELQWWYTEAFDAALVGQNFICDRVAEATARTLVRQADPEKFARLRELERLAALNNTRHQHLASGSHASILEANLRTRTIYVP